MGQGIGKDVNRTGDLNMFLISSSVKPDQTTEKDDVESEFDRAVTRFEFEAAQLSRGFRSALFVQRFKARKNH